MQSKDMRDRSMLGMRCKAGACKAEAFKAKACKVGACEARACDVEACEAGACDVGVCEAVAFKSRIRADHLVAQCMERSFYATGSGKRASARHDSQVTWLTKSQDSSKTGRAR